MENKVNGHGYLRISTKWLLGVLAAALLTVSGVVYAGQVKRIDDLEIKVEAQQTIIVEVRRDVKWIRDFLSK